MKALFVLVLLGAVVLGTGCKCGSDAKPTPSTDTSLEWSEGEGDELDEAERKLGEMAGAAEEAAEEAAEAEDNE